MSEFSRADLETYQRNLFNRAAKHTIHLYRFVSIDEEGVVEPQPLATGVVVLFKDRFYLVTAEHVFNGEDLKTIGCFVNGQPLMLGCGPVYICGDDVAYTTLSEEIISKLSCEEIVPYLLEESRGLNLKYNITHYLLYGYPSSRIKDTAKKDVRRVYAFPFFTIILDKEETDKRCVCFESDNQFSVDFHKDKLASFSTEKTMKQTGPKPGGLSGSGLWYFDVDKVVLVGIMTGYDIAKAIFLGTKIDVLIEYLDKRTTTKAITEKKKSHRKINNKATI